MMKIFFLLSLFVLFSLNAFEKPFAGADRPPRKIKIGSAPFAVLTPGKTKVEILIAPDAYKTTRFAASELKTFLGKRLNTPIPVVNKPGKADLTIVLGINQWSKAAGLQESRLCRDGFFIKTSGKRVYILGRDDAAADPWDKLFTGHHLAADQCYERGTLFGVYDFLERFANLRFFFPCDEGIIIPKGAFTLPVTDIFDRPDFEVRWHSPYNGYWPDEPADPSKARGQVKRRGRVATPAKNLNWYRNRMQTKHIGNSHGISHLHLARRFGKSHPEYFALKADGTRDNKIGSHSGHLCFASPVREIVYQDVKAYLTGQRSRSRGIPNWNYSATGHGTFSLVQPDSWVPCRCKVCWAHFSKGAESSSTYIWDFVAEIARRLQKEKVPGAVLNLAYHGYKTLPKTDLPSNVHVQVAVEGPWGERFPEIQKKNDELVRNWVAKKKGKVWLWNYALKWGAMTIPGLPSCTPRAFGSYYKRMAPYIYGAFIESGTDHFIFNTLTYYVFGKITWNNQVDVDALINDYAVSMFGKGAKEMTAFLDRFEYLWLNHVIGRTVETPLGPVPATATAAELWGKIYSAKELENLRAFVKKAETRAAGDPEALKRIRFVARGYLDPLEKTFERNMFLQKSIATFTETIPAPPAAQKITVDGEISEKAWEKAAKLYMQPYKAEKRKTPHPVNKTLVRVLADKENLYLAFDCEEPAPGAVYAPTKVNSENRGFNENSVELFLSPDAENKICYHMIINSNGAFFRMKWKVGGSKFVPDVKWQGAFKVKSRLNAKSWTAEAVIPWSAIRGFNGKKIAANFTRNQIKSDTALYSWSPFMENNFHEVRNFGTLLFNAPAPSISQIKNGDFQDAKRTPRKIGAWSITKADAAAGKIELDPAHFVKGGQSVRFSGLKNKNERTGILQTLTLKPNTNYILSFYARTEKILPFDGKPGRGAAIILRFDGQNHILPRGWIVGTNPWTHYVYEFKTGALKDKGAPYIFLRLSWASGTVWYDDIKITEIKEK